jgi:hypothetical protein
MSDASRKEQVPTREALEREARRLTRVRHLTVVRDIGRTPAAEPLRAAVGESDPDPKTAA